MSLEHFVIVEADVIDISTILIYSLYHFFRALGYFWELPIELWRFLRTCLYMVVYHLQGRHLADRNTPYYVRSSNGQTILWGKEKLAWWFVTCSSDIGKPERYHRKSIEFYRSGWHPRSGLNWLRLTIALLKPLFWESGLSLGENVRSMIGQRRACALFPSRRCRFWRILTLDVVLVVVVLQLQGIDHCSGRDLFFFFFFLL